MVRFDSILTHWTKLFGINNAAILTNFIIIAHEIINENANREDIIKKT